MEVLKAEIIKKIEEQYSGNKILPIVNVFCEYIFKHDEKIKVLENIIIELNKKLSIYINGSLH